MGFLDILGNIIYGFMYITAWLYFKIVHNSKIKGKENRPEEGPFIIMANHITAYDPPLVGTIMNRKVHFMAKKELFENPFIGKILRAIGTFPVKRGKPDRSAFRESFRLLNNNKVICIFPEGTRSKTGELGNAKAGSIMIALKSETPILPVGIKKVGRQFRVSIGEPFTLDEYYGEKLSRDERKIVGKNIMEKIENEINKI
ncbi:MAG: lysophospholipid acyltransferase family protein [Bacillota bacterium]